MKNMKIFRAGKYPQGEFNELSALIENVKSVPAIIFHTGHHLRNGILEKDIPILGEFCNFVIKGAELFADFVFNDKGREYFNKNKFKNISVEINPITNKLIKVGLLPPNIEPQISDLSSFEDTKYKVIEFQIEEGGYIMTKEEMVVALLAMPEEDQKEISEALLKAGSIDARLHAVTTVKDSITTEERNAARIIASEFSEAVKEPVKFKTEAEIRAEIKAEYEAREQQIKTNAEFALIEAAMKKKVEPVHHAVYSIAIESAKTGLEFSKIIDIKQHIESLPDHSLLSEFSHSKGNINDTDKIAMEIKAIKDEIIQRNKGGK